jgi:molybdopterin-guanine dinucleotide biosynthesis protein A
MGSPKEGVRLNESTLMIEPVLRALGECCSTVVIVGACSGYDPSTWPGVLHLRDLRPGLGPLSGIETLLASGVAEGYVVAACDQPALTAPLLSRLAGDGKGRFFRGAAGARFHPLPGYYPATWVHAVGSAIEEGRLSLRAFVQSQEIAWVPFASTDEGFLQNLNTPQDVEAFRRGAP